MKPTKNKEAEAEAPNLSTSLTKRSAKRRRPQQQSDRGSGNIMVGNQLLLEEDDGVGGVGDEDIFVYTGGDQEVPRDVERVRIAENVYTIPERTFGLRFRLIEVEGHNKIKKIECGAFYNSLLLRRVTKMRGVIEVEKYAFFHCPTLSALEIDKLEIIGEDAFARCSSLRSINMPSIRRVGPGAFQYCDKLTDAVFGEKLERIEGGVFFRSGPRRITIPLKDNLIININAFNRCENLSRVDVLDGGIHETISSLHMETWRNETENEMDSINQTLPNIRSNDKSQAIQQWITRVLGRMEHYRSEHELLVKEAMALLELALWKAKLLNEAGEKKCNINEVSKKAKIDAEAARKEHRVTCGANIVIKNVLPFLTLK